MINISSGPGFARFVLLVFLCSARSVNGQSASSSQNVLSENPAPKASARDMNESAGESAKAAAINNPAARSHRFTMTTNLWIASSLAVYTAAALDMNATEETVRRVNALHKRVPWFPENYSFESNPLARPLLKLPAPAYYACGIALATGINYVGLRMSHSKRFRRVWWLPQALSVAGNTHGYLSYQ
ncbi:MAG TPA: hypothetical protein VL128_16125 [Candidatus Eisenbacteria bacterium]|nr:hypothetical protein [Candidatus Eisenbacteria bacterium]